MTDDPVLVLFDIDGTLLRGRGDGVGAMVDAMTKLYPDRSFSLEGIPIAGRLDTLIWRDVMQRAGLPTTDHDETRFRDAFIPALERRIAEGAQFRQMPGAHKLVQRLQGEPDVVVGLLTGNYPTTARMKIVAAGYDAAHFRLGAYAGDGPDRRSLPPVAMRRFSDLLKRDARPQRVVIIGDTPHDVDCAKHHGCRALGVATGDFTVDALAPTGADLVVQTLEDTEAMVQWIADGSAVRA